MQNFGKTVATLASSLALVVGCGNDVVHFGDGSGDSAPPVVNEDAGDGMLAQDTSPSPEAGEDGAGDARADGFEAGDSGGSIEAGDSAVEAGDSAFEVGDSASPGPMVFNIIFRQTVQNCADCGIWFDWQEEQDDKPKLVVEFERQGCAYESAYQHDLGGMDNAFGFYLAPNGKGVKHSILVKQAPRRTGLFRADISDIPSDASITKATLHLHINTDMGFSDTDVASVLSVYACEKTWNWDHATWSQYDDGKNWDEQGGDFGAFIRPIRAKEDILDRGFGSDVPNVFFDFTSYVVQLQAAR